MKKTLLILSLMSVAGVASAATTYAEKQTIDSATNLGQGSAVFYNGGLELTAEGSLLEPTNHSWSNAYINGLSGEGSINIDRPEGGGNADLIWLDGTCSGFTGSITVNGNEHMGGTGLIVGNTDAAFTMANADVTIGKGTNKNGQSILALANDASLATATGKEFLMNGGKIRHINAPTTTAFSSAIANDSGLSAVTGTAVTLTLGTASFEGTTIEKGVKTVINGNATINGLTANDAVELNGTTNTLSGAITTAKGTTMTLAQGATTTVNGTVNGNVDNFGAAGSMTMAGGALSLAETAVVHVNGLKLQNNATISLANGAELGFRLGGANDDYNCIRVTSLNDTQTASVSGNAIGIFNNTATNYTVSNAQVTMGKIGQNFASSAALYDNVAVTLNGGAGGADATKVFTFTNAASTFVSLDAHGQSFSVNGAATASTLKDVAATGGDVTVYNLGEGTQLESLTLSNGKNISFYSSADSTTLASVGLTTQLTVTGADSTLNANLAVNGATLTFADDALLTVSGSVTLSNAVVALTQTMVDTIAANGRVDLFTGMTNADLGNITFVRADGQELAQAGVYKVSFDGTSIYVTPEPATATLSLLALAALAARRKRA